MLDRVARRKSPTIRENSRDKRMSNAPCLQLLLTMWAGRVTINIVSDDVLLIIFHFARGTHLDGREGVNRWYLCWHQLVHVCHRWRSIVFASPNFLDLRLVLGPNTRMELLGIWPPLPIAITNTTGRTTPEYYDFNAAIAHRNRVCEIDLRLEQFQLQLLASAMQEQFPVLIHLKLEVPQDPHDYGQKIPLPDEFLGGFAPRLQSLNLKSIPFPTLPKFLLSATDLVRLTLWDIPNSGYISPEAIVTSLAVLANLKFLTIGFE